MHIQKNTMLITSTTKTIALCSLSNLINAADRAIMPIAIIQMAPEFKWDMHDQGWILSAFPLGYFSSQVGKIKLFNIFKKLCCTFMYSFDSSCSYKFLLKKRRNNYGGHHPKPK